MKKLDDITLMAHADAELSEEESSETEAALRIQEDARKRFESFRATGALLKNTYGGVLNEPIPDHLLETIARCESPSDNVRHLHWKWRRNEWMALAASLFIGVVVGAVGVKFSGMVDSKTGTAVVAQADAEAEKPYYEKNSELETRALEELYYKKNSELETRVFPSIFQSRVPEPIDPGYRILTLEKPSPQLLEGNASGETVTMIFSANVKVERIPLEAFPSTGGAHICREVRYLQDTSPFIFTLCRTGRGDWNLVSVRSENKTLR